MLGMEQTSAPEDGHAFCHFSVAADPSLAGVRGAVGWNKPQSLSQGVVQHPVLAMEWEVSASSLHVPPRVWEMAEFWMQQRDVSEGRLNLAGRESSLPFRMFNAPEHFCALFLCSQWLFLGLSQDSSCLVFSAIFSAFSPCPSGWVSAPQRSAALISFSSSAHRVCVCPCPIGWRSGPGCGSADFTNQSFLVELLVCFWEFITQSISGSRSWHLQPN